MALQDFSLQSNEINGMILPPTFMACLTPLDDLVYSRYIQLYIIYTIE